MKVQIKAFQNLKCHYMKSDAEQNYNPSHSVKHLTFN